MWDKAGMARNAEGLNEATEIASHVKSFRKMLGSRTDKGFNQD
jgi:hypothetical protein